MKKLFYILLILFLCVATSEATTQYYYLRTTGAGSNSGDTGTWVAVPSSDAHAMSASNFNTSGNWSATENVNLLDPDDVVYVKGSGWTTSYNITPIYGLTIDGVETDTYDPIDATNATHQAAMTNMNSAKILLNVDNMTIQEVRFGWPSYSIRNVVNEAVNISGLTVTRVYFDNGTDGSDVLGPAIYIPLITDSTITYNLYDQPDMPAWLGGDIPTGCKEDGRFILIHGGVNNVIAYNTINGGHTAIIFLHSLDHNGDVAGIDIPSSGSYAIDPEFNLMYNEVAYNNVLRRCEEGIAFDMGQLGTNMTSVELDTVTVISGTDITLNNGGGEWTGWTAGGGDWSGLYVISMKADNTGFGEHALIESQSDNVLTIGSNVSTAMPNLEVDDTVIIGAIFKRNWFHHNTLPGSVEYGGFPNSAMSFYGMSFENLVEDNVLDHEYGMKIVAGRNLEGSIYNATGVAGTAPSAYNIFRANSAGWIQDIVFDFTDDSGSPVFYNRNNSFDNNTFLANNGSPGQDSALTLVYANTFTQDLPLASNSSDYSVLSTDPTASLTGWPFTFTISDPSPVDGATDQSTLIGLLWTNAPDYTGVTIYLKVDDQGGSCTFVVGDKVIDNDTVATVSNAAMLTHLSLSGALDVDTDYCWQGVTHAATGDEESDVLNFTTAPGPPPDPGPNDGAVSTINGKHFRFSSGGNRIVSP